MPEALEDAYYRYFKKALDDIFTQNNLLKLMQKRSGLADQAVEDILRWMRKSFQASTENNPFEEEISRLNQWASTPWSRWKQHWHVPINYLKNEYSGDDIDASFYRAKFKQLLDPEGNETLPDSKDEAELVIKDLLAQWDARLQAKLLKLHLTRLQQQQADFQELMEAKVAEYTKLETLLSPFGNYAGRYWDLSRDLWQDTSFSILEKYNELLEQEEEVQKLADMLGKMREAQIELEEETFERVIVQQQWLEDAQARSEIDGIHSSNDLSAMLSSEAGLLSSEETETAFLQKYADQRLLTFRYHHQELVTSEHLYTETEQRVKRKEKGPFIICVDTSDSMKGRPEEVAKVLCFAILRMAAKDDRKAYLINFSTGINTIDLFNIADSIDSIAAFLTMSFHGGTDISPALYEVLRQLRQDNYEDADVLVISDFIMYRVEEDILRGVQNFRQNKGTQFHSLTLAKNPVEKLVDIFDSNWIYDPEQKGIFKSLAGQLEDIRTRNS